MSISTSVSGIKNGYLSKESYYLKQSRKRWIVLNRKYLYSYKDINCSYLTEKIDLSKFDAVAINSKNGDFQFEITSKHKKNTKNRRFIAASMEDMNEWIKYIKNAINNDNDNDVNDVNDDDEKTKDNDTKINKIRIASNLYDIMNKYHSKINDWDFDVFQFMDDPLHCDKGLVFLSFYLFKICGLLEATKINKCKLWNFLENVECAYLNNPYHNKYHAVDVLLSTNYMFKSSFFSKHMTIWDQLGAYIAALCHDLGHMGFNNNWYINTGDNLALLYNDKSVLENYHIAQTFGVLRSDENVNWMSPFPLSIRRYLSTIIRRTILSTDIAVHAEKVKSLKNMVNVYKKNINITSDINIDQQCKLITNNIKLYRSESIAMYASLYNILEDDFKLFLDENKTVNDIIINEKKQQRIDGIDDERLFLLEISIHAADIANPCKPINIAKQWATRYLSEAYKQGDNERLNGIPVSIGMDRFKTTLKNSQIGFIQYVVKDLFKFYSQIIDVANIPLNIMNQNEKYWIQQTD